MLNGNTDEYINDFVYSQYDYLKEVFYKYTKPRYLLVGSVILGSCIISHKQILTEFANNLQLFSCALLGGMIFFHDEIESISTRYVEDGILCGCNEYFASKYLVAKEQYEYYKDFICS